MSQEEAKRGQILELLKAHKITPKQASNRLGVSQRQVRRLAKRYQTEGLDGLISKKRGKPSTRRLDGLVMDEVTRLIGTLYPDFGPTLAHEKLTELHNISLSVESTRQLMSKR